MTTGGNKEGADESRGVSLRQHPRIVVGVTHHQTCLTLTGRMRALRDSLFDVTLVSSPGRLSEQIAVREGAQWKALPIEREIAPISDFISMFRLISLLLRMRPEMTEFSTPKAGLLGSIAAMLAGVPVRIYMLRGLKLETAKGLKRRVLLITEKIAAACAHVVVCNSQSLRDRADSLGIAPASKLVVLGKGSSNGIDVRRFMPGESDVREKLGVAGNDLVVGYVGRLTRDKGIPDLVEAFDAILDAEPRAHLLLVGWADAAEDRLPAYIQRRIESHPRIHCTGFVDETAPYYKAMDVMVLSSLREGFPNVVLEAAASAVPVITTDVTGARDSVVPGETGLLIPSGSPSAIAESVLQLLRQPALRARMGEAARAWVCRHFTDEEVLGHVTSYYQDLLTSAIAEKRTGLVSESVAAR
jgi:glycosyltransferase involved in cell wall biosynthesis